MNIDEMLFNKAFHTETLFLQHAWMAEQKKDYNRRDRALERAANSRPKIYLDTVCTCDGQEPCAIHWDKYIISNLCICQEPPESPDPKCPRHGDADNLRP